MTEEPTSNNEVLQYALNFWRLAKNEQAKGGPFADEIQKLRMKAIEEAQAS